MIPNNTFIEKYRLNTWRFPSTAADGNNGVFLIPGPRGPKLAVIASDGMGWEHVSVLHVDGKTRCPYWDEMCFVKDIFWGPEETVIQYHPPKSEYVNNHPSVLHLWRPTGVDLPLPPSILTGIKSLGTLKT